jgi:hypothetical protein
LEIKHGQIWINTGFEAVYKTKFYHSIVRILSVQDDVITVRSLSDTRFGEFAFGGPMGEPFVLCRKKNFESGHFRPYKSGDLSKFIKHRNVNRILYAD